MEQLAWYRDPVFGRVRFTPHVRRHTEQHVKLKGPCRLTGRETSRLVEQPHYGRLLHMRIIVFTTTTNTRAIETHTGRKDCEYNPETGVAIRFEKEHTSQKLGKLSRDRHRHESA